MPFVTADRRTTVGDGLAVDVRDRETVTVDVRVIAEDVDRDGAVFRDREAVVLMPPAHR